MASPYERYLKTLSINSSATAEARRYQNDVVNNIAFSLADGYKLAKIQTRQDYDINKESWEDFEILVKHALSVTEKKIVTRPHVDLQVGTYLSYDDVTIIVQGRTLGKEEVMPTYKALVCNHKLKLKGCPYEFPISSSNTSYSAKGVIDADLINLIDTRNKFYIQRNKYTVRLFQNHKNYRIAIGDEEVQYYYVITNMDDSSTPGLFAVTLNEDEKTHLDNEYAYNEVEIDYSDLNDTYDEETGETTEAKPLPIISCGAYQYKDKPFGVVSNVPISFYEITDGLQAMALSDDKLELTLLATTLGTQKITIVDNYGQEVTKNIIVKEG
jgi:hypothetical protein